MFIYLRFFRFELQLKKNGTTDTEQRPVKVAGDTTSYTFYGLIPGQTYTMTITAIMSDQVRSKPKETQVTVGKLLHSSVPLYRECYTALDANTLLSTLNISLKI